MVQFGFVTNCLGPTTITEAVTIAEQLGCDCLEVGPSVARDRTAFEAVQRGSPVRLHSFIYGRNFLTTDTARHTEYRSELLRLLDLAAALGVRQITTATGVNPALTLDENIQAALDYWTPLFEQARQADIRIALEFCPISGNFALGPYAWRRLFAATSRWPNFGLNYDPSHLLWQFIDPYPPIAEFGARLFSAHAKDTYIWPERLSEHGILTPYARREQTAHGVVEDRALWWEYRLPGAGSLDWERCAVSLLAAGFDGAIHVEHEDPRYQGSRPAIIDALRRSLDFLRRTFHQAREKHVS